MQFTPEVLRRHAQVLVEKEVQQNRDILAVYLRGSLLYGSPLLGGAGDIDLVFVHSSPPELDREIRKLTPEIHFDIEHHDQLPYRSPREMRLDPWFGPSLRDALPLHDPRHLLDYTQSGVRSNFDFPENLQTRSRTLLDQARQFWLDRQINPHLDILTEFSEFLSALEKAVNAVALIAGPPLPVRRLGSDFPHRADQLDAPALAVAFEHLLGAVNLPKERLLEWLDDWSQAMQTLQGQSSRESLLTEQETYFSAALDNMIQNEPARASLWPLLKTWTEIIFQLSDRTQVQATWIAALTKLGFAGSDYQVRLAVFDGFLDLCEALVQKETEGSG
jgi:hypothetical protein